MEVEGNLPASQLGKTMSHELVGGVRVKMEAVKILIAG